MIQFTGYLPPPAQAQAQPAQAQAQAQWPPPEECPPEEVDTGTGFVRLVTPPVKLVKSPTAWPAKP